MYTAFELKNLTMKPRINDISLQVLADYYTMFLYPFIYRYSVKNNGIDKKIELCFGKENFCHLVGMETVAKYSVPYQELRRYKGLDGWNSIYGNNEDGFVIDIPHLKSLNKKKFQSVKAKFVYFYLLPNLIAAPILCCKYIIKFYMGGTQMNKSSIAIITARGGSKRIPHKNIKDFCGKPIITYSIEAALHSELFAEVMVSTDDEEIARIAKQAGAKVPFMRSSENAGDYASTDDVLKEVLNWYREQGKEFETFCCLYPTAPFITAQKLQKAMRMLEKADSVMPVVAFSYPPQRCVVLNEQGELRMKWPEYARTRSQDLEPYYHDCGQFYCCRTKPFLEYGTTDLPHMVPMFISELEVQDIDNPDDWEIAELKYQKMIRAGEDYGA